MTAPVRPDQHGAAGTEGDDCCSPASGTRPEPVVPDAAIIAAVLVLCVVLVVRGPLSGLVDVQATTTWATIAVSVCVQAVPFLALGILISTVIATVLPSELLMRALPARPGLAVPVAGLAGALLPGCECGSVPVASGLISRGVPQGVALTFLLSAPAVNPIVLVSTYVAFPAQPAMVLARLVAALATAVLVGLLWCRFGKPQWLLERAVHTRHGRTSRGGHALQVATHDFLQAGGFLVLGAMTSAALHVLVPRSVLDTFGGQGALAVLTLVVLAIVLAVCSEADAFVAASFTQFSRTAQLAFMVVGPVVDVKLVALHVGTFGRRFAARFCPLALAAAVTASVLTGSLL
ncbi:MAG TPA: permease [Mycobacteriales bacterium]|nr:permease [Mycobacteriales bacterium]